jgi:hypothetical protein
MDLLCLKRMILCAGAAAIAQPGRARATPRPAAKKCVVKANIFLLMMTAAASAPAFAACIPSTKQLQCATVASMLVRAVDCFKEFAFNR